MYKITIKIPHRKCPDEVIFGYFWLAYHLLHSLYAVEENKIDEAFKTAEKEPCLIEAKGKSFIIEQVKMSPEQIHNDLHLSVSILTPEISMAEDEDRQYIKLERGFITQLQRVLKNILKSI